MDNLNFFTKHMKYIIVESRFLFFFKLLIIYTLKNTPILCYVGGDMVLMMRITPHGKAVGNHTYIKNLHESSTSYNIFSDFNIANELQINCK